MPLEITLHQNAFVLKNAYQRKDLSWQILYIFDNSFNTIYESIDTASCNIVGSNVSIHSQHSFKKHYNKLPYRMESNKITKLYILLKNQKVEEENSIDDKM